MVAAAALKSLKSAYQVWNSEKGKNSEPVFDIYADDIDFRSIADGAPSMEFSQKRAGKAEVRAYFADLAKDWQMNFFHVRNYLAQGNTVAVVCECCWRHRRTGRIVHSPKLDLYEFKGKKAVRFFEYFDNELAISSSRGESDDKKAKPPKPLYPEKGARILTAPSASAAKMLKPLKNAYKQWDASKGRSVDTFMGFLAAHVSWGSLANGAAGLEFTRRHMSREQVAEYFHALGAAWEMHFYRVEKYLSAGNFILTLGNVEFKNKATGKVIRTPKADLWQFSNGKAIEFFEYYDTANVLAATRP